MHRQLFEYHPTIGYRFVPNIKTRIRHESGGYLVRTNNLGFRSNVNFVNEKNPHQKRILLFGDSFTAGDGVSNPKRFSDLIPQLIPGTEVYNFGLSGIAPDQEYLIWQEYAREIEHDLVVIVVLVENIRRVNARYRIYYQHHIDFNDDVENQQVIYEKPCFEMNESGELTLSNTPVNRHPIKLEDLPQSEQDRVDKGGRFSGVRKLIRKIGFKDILQKVARYQPVPEYNSAENEKWQLMQAILKKWVDEIEKPVLIVPLPMHQFVMELSNANHYQNRFHELAQLCKVDLHDPLPGFLRDYDRTQRELFRFPKDAHPSPFGHEAIAKSLAVPISKILSQN